MCEEVGMHSELHSRGQPPVTAPVTVLASSSTWMGKSSGAWQLGAACLGVAGDLMLRGAGIGSGEGWRK